MPRISKHPSTMPGYAHFKEYTEAKWLSKNTRPQHAVRVVWRDGQTLAIVDLFELFNIR